MKHINNEDLCYLERYLDANSKMLNLTMLNGIFTAIVCGPVNIVLGDVMPSILNNINPGYGADKFLAALNKLYDEVLEYCTAIREGLFPLFLPPGNKTIAGDDKIITDWSKGFFMVILRNPSDWICHNPAADKEYMALYYSALITVAVCTGAKEYMTVLEQTIEELKNISLERKEMIIRTAKEKLPNAIVFIRDHSVIKNTGGYIEDSKDTAIIIH